MKERVRKDHPSVYADVGMHEDVEITLTLDGDIGEGSTIRFGHDGPDVTIVFADLDSLERLATVTAQGVRSLRQRLDEQTRAAQARERGGEADRLAEAGVVQ